MKSCWLSLLIFSLLFVCSRIPSTRAHGRLLEPPSRSSMWRGVSKDPMLRPYKRCIKRNYNDNALYCGGASTQHRQNGGRCGVCGDSYSAAVKPNEAGGKYAKGIITRRYRSGETIPIKVEITAEHKGYFEFRLCPWNRPSQVVTHRCLNRYLLKFGDGNTKWYMPLNPAKARGVHNLQIKLPRGVTCAQCVLQWRYRTGNSWGRENGEAGLGLGPQEEFYGCSDIAIGTNETLPTLCSNGAARPQPARPQPATTVELTTTPGWTKPSSPTTTSQLSKKPRPSRQPQSTQRPRPSRQSQTTRPRRPSRRPRPRPNRKQRKPKCNRRTRDGRPVCFRCKRGCCSGFYRCANNNAFIFSCANGTTCNRRNGRCELFGSCSAS